MISAAEIRYMVQYGGKLAIARAYLRFGIGSPTGRTTSIYVMDKAAWRGDRWHLMRGWSREHKFSFLNRGVEPRYAFRKVLTITPQPVILAV